MTDKQIVVIGAGLAGLSCAIECEKLGLDYIIIDKNKYVGGRQQTSNINGYICDHGFQVLLTAYPTARKLLDFEQLDLQYFKKGAYCWNGKTFNLYCDPRENIIAGLKMLFNNQLSYIDITTLLNWAYTLNKSSSTDIFAQPNQSTQQLLDSKPLSYPCKKLFLEPFFKGIFLFITTFASLFLICFF